MTHDVILRLTHNQALILHRVLREAESLAASGKGFKSMARQGSETRHEFIALQVEAQTHHDAILRSRSATEDKEAQFV